MALALGAVAILTPAPSRAQTSLDPALSIHTVTTGLTRPVALDWLAEDDILVVERETARVRRVIGGVLQAASVYQHPVATEDLLGIAVNSAMPPQVFLFVEDTTGTAGNRVLRTDWNPATGQLENVQTLVGIVPSGLAGNADDGGKLLLGPPDDTQSPPTVGDGQLLYVVSGFVQRTGQLRNDPLGDPPDNAGVILRILQDGTAAPGNPFAPYCSATTSTSCVSDPDCPAGEACLTQVGLYWSYGLRNSFGIDIDPVTGELWDEENGENEYDEINRVVRGMNSGWTAVMGPMPTPTVPLFEMPGGAAVYRDPEYTWLAPTGPTGLAFPAGSSFGPAYEQSVLFADFNLPSQLYALPLDPARTAIDLADRVAESQAELDAFAIATGFTSRVVATEFGPDGHLYVVTYFDGTIRRIEGPGRAAVPALPAPAFGVACAVLLAGVAVAGSGGWRRR